MKLARFIGLLLGSIVCAVIFGIAGVITGLVFPWINDNRYTQEDL